MNNIVVDWESYYSKKDGISVVEQGVANYLKSADAYIISIVSDDVEFCGTLEQAREHFPAAFWADPQNQFWAANSNFDQSWAEKYGWTTARPWKCVLDKGKFSQYGNTLASQVQTALKIKLDKKLRDDMDGVDFFSLDSDHKQRLIEYCLQDSIQTKRLLETLPEMTSVEDDIAELTRLQNRRGISIDTDLVAKDKSRLHEIRHEAYLKIPWRNSEKPLSHAALATFCRAEGIPCPASTDKRDEDCKALMSEHPKLAEVLTSLRTFRRAGTLIEKAEALERRVTEDNILPLDLLYCGARHTRRWSSQGFNIQNLDKEPWNDVWSRKWVVPAPGKIFIILDYAQIEPRCLNWLVNNEEMLSAMRVGYGIYEAYALAVKGWRGNPGTLKKSDPKGYSLIKSEVIGLGYGMGAAKYVAHTAQSGISLSLEESQKIVKSFRAGNPKITALWRSFDTLIAKAVLDKSNTLTIELPTGDKLQHYHIKSKIRKSEAGRISTSYESFTIRGEFGFGSIQTSLWGGLATENAVQRMARDILAEGMLKLEKAGLTVKVSIHDEVVLEVDDDASKHEALEEAKQILRQPPEWAPDIPLEVEGGFETTYVK